MPLHTPLLDDIEFPYDLRKIQPIQLPELCGELRQFIIETVLAHGGHFAANLGVVELTVALHYVFNTPDDRLVWDVGHQAYGHKILTGRKNLFHTNRKFGGLSGFPKMDESLYDTFGTGHSSTAISAALGMATAAKLDGNTLRHHIAVVGDGALTAGQAFEGLNNLAISETRFLLIINDNDIGIDPNHGAVNRHLNHIDAKHNLFVNMGLSYSGPEDGHDVLRLIETFEALKKRKGPQVLHIRTIKGKGFEPAEREQTKWHSTSKFVKIETPGGVELNSGLRFQDIFGSTLLELAQENPKLVGVTPAMPTGSGMIKAMQAYPARFFDVGIAEQHAVTFSGGMAKEGYTVICHLYSTFLQRAYDQVIHDICIQNLPVIFCIDRAGNVGEDGPTHHGLYDIPMLMPLPNMTIVTPASGQALRNALHYYSKNLSGPVAIRYPKGMDEGPPIQWNGSGNGTLEPDIEEMSKGSDVAILSVGNMFKLCDEAMQLLRSSGIEAALYKIEKIKPINKPFVKSLFSQFKVLVCVEDGSIVGGFGSLMASLAAEYGYNGKLEIVGFPAQLIEHGSSEELFHKYKMDAQGILNRVRLLTD